MINLIFGELIFTLFLFKSLKSLLKRFSLLFFRYFVSYVIKRTFACFFLNSLSKTNWAVALAQFPDVAAVIAGPNTDGKGTKPVKNIKDVRNKLIFKNLKIMILSQNYIQIGAFIYLLSTFFVAAGLFIPSFNAQEENRTIEEVVVSALRQETSLQDTAITVTAITGDSLETQQIENMEDLQFAVPTLGFQKGAYAGSGITLRGIGNFAVGNSTSSSVGYFWNGQVGSISSLYEAELFDVERVEVLRGPQGTLFGAGTTGGLLQVISKRPNSEYGGYVKADIAEFDSTRISAAVDLPLSDTVRSLLSDWFGLFL